MSSISVYAFETHGDETATEWTTQNYAEAEAYAKENGYSIIEREYEYSDSSLVADFREGHDSTGEPVDGHVCGEDEEEPRAPSVSSPEPWWVGRPDRDQLTGAYNPESQVQDPLTGEWHTKSR